MMPTQHWVNKCYWRNELMRVSFQSTTSIAKAGEDTQEADIASVTHIIQSQPSSQKLDGVYICTPTLLAPFLVWGLG